MNLIASFDWDYVFDMPNLLFLLATLVAIAGIVAATWHNTAVATERLRLKQMMVERGYSPEDILRVVNGGEPSGRKPQVHAAVLRGTAATAGQGCSQDACC
ncbi:MAG: hypothetical protein JSU68_12860 [Phycisphaerales bacterium]|nr:MAG: hypothetical protein JSU68_12860 [Phycisphaerales bacterium]